ncbi:hypothetical protein CIL05_19470 [Virgibacillus profundi]|uniref:Yip1 domain-containing protein n=1 Tax=Virgibacillus profundi TaxID=2024555 RepID=A0A2A2I9X6_9BACI|nr:hypothetical protein [Virgibacillus profundi]PAV27863.1 hypothetical protein CIL05_19470 [Virgibacillus profundi]PXY52041.1 hypothetical protein CIT14_19575 [Virgibacillus profundi]
MTYYVNVFRILFSLDDHLFRIRKAEKIHNLWKVSSLLFLLSIIIYAWMAFLGIGSDIISTTAVQLTPVAYEQSKFWFIIGRMAYAVLFAALILFLPTLLFYLLTGAPFRKLLIMQQVVLLVMLIERIIWIPLVTLNGLDWFVSPLSFGIIASYITEVPWAIYFFGAISLFQLWIIWFQVKYLLQFTELKKHWIWINVIGLHILFWCVTALLAYVDTYIVSGWFG